MSLLLCRNSVFYHCSFVVFQSDELFFFLWNDHISLALATKFLEWVEGFIAVKKDACDVNLEAGKTFCLLTWRKRSI